MTNPPFPIPPNCPSFREFTDGWYFELLIAGLRYRVNDNKPWLRPIIAAVAEVAWLREAERLMNEQAEIGDPGDVDRWNARERGKRAAWTAARACRAWGEQE